MSASRGATERSRVKAGHGVKARGAVRTRGVVSAPRGGGRGEAGAKGPARGEAGAKGQGRGEVGAERPARGEATRGRILNAAEAILVRGGGRSLSLRAVAARAGVALGNLQYHYPSLDALLGALLARVLARGAERVGAAAEGANDDVGAVVDALLGDHDDPRLVRLFIEIWALAASKPRLRAPLVAFYDDFAAALAAGLRRRGVCDAEARARLAIALLEGLSLFRSGVCGVRRDDADAAARAALVSFLRG